MEQPLITVIMPTYNSQRTIEKALQSIRMQSIAAERLEILVIDGGSTDATLEIAKKYGAVILQNPHRLPEPAKWIGLQQAQGKYAMWQDSDEELLAPDQLEKRLIFLDQHPEVKCMVCDEQFPGPNCGVAARYLCVCGDPFTQFIYRRKNGVVATFAKSIVKQSQEGCLFHFAPGDPVPIGDGGTSMFDLDWIKRAFPGEWDSQSFACSIFSRVCNATGYCGCIPGDNIRHHARARFFTYLSKLKFRVVNNLFHPEESGYAARTTGGQNAALRKRRKWFILYALTLLWPVFDSVRMAVQCRDASMLLHFVYVYDVCVCTAYYGVKRAFGKSEKNKSYGKG